MVKRWMRQAAAGLLLWPLATLADSKPPEGLHRITLHSRDGQSWPLGTVQFTPRPDGRSGFTLALEPARFKDFFLSMKEFKCLDGGGEVMCHVPYPYSQPASVAPNDWAWLEHSLLFMFKQPHEFGAKLWNGIYFELRPSGRGLEGRPQAVDLNRIGAPPARLDLPPYPPALRDEVAPESRWFNRLTVEPQP